MSIPWSGPRDPAPDAGWQDPPARKGFFTDTSVCIGCKACEVACKEWNAVPEDGLAMLGSSYDNTGALGASTWRHVAFIEQSKPLGRQESGVGRPTVDLGMPSFTPPSGPDGSTGTDGVEGDGNTPTLVGERPDFRWLMSSDVCKHCTNAACLDVCPTGSLFRTEFGTVVVQDDICNGCGYCVPACPFGVIERRSGPEGAKNVGIAQKCTLCYDRIGAGQTPACARSSCTPPG
jgi:formate dehydrogenase iron-sulfur subunit